jgi:hypothetical protein
MPDEPRRRLLHPVLVSGGGRSGTTLLMLLLGTSPQVAFPRVHPYEHRYLTYLLRWAQLLRPGRAPEGWNQVALVGRAEETLGPILWPPADLLEDRGDFWQACFLAAWEVLSDRAAAGAQAGQPGTAATHYAEKTPPWVAGELAGLLPFTAFMPIRDPRDVFLSIVAFATRRGQPGFGMQAGEAPADFARRFVPHQRRRLAEARRARRDGSAAVVRYEDLVADLPGQAERLSRLLGVHLDPAAVPGPDPSPARHMTSASVADSVGRWRREMDPALLDMFREGLGRELAALDYEV